MLQTTDSTCSLLILYWLLSNSESHLDVLKPYLKAPLILSLITIKPNAYALYQFYNASSVYSYPRTPVVLRVAMISEISLRWKPSILVGFPFLLALDHYQVFLVCKIPCPLPCWSVAPQFTRHFPHLQLSKHLSCLILTLNDYPSSLTSSTAHAFSFTNLWFIPLRIGPNLLVPLHQIWGLLHNGRDRDLFVEFEALSFGSPPFCNDSGTHSL